MKILVTSINFHPDHSGIALYSTDLPKYFAEKGHDVTMVTGFSYYPKWEKTKKDKYRLFGSEIFKKVKVLRGYLYVPKKVTTVSRIIHELSFLFFAFINFIRAGKHGSIIVISPPLLLGLVGLFFKKVWKAKLIFHIQDIQPDAALMLKMIKENLMIRILKKIEKIIYNGSDLIVTISDGMHERLLAKGVPRNKLAIYYNWIDVEKASTIRPSGKFRGQFPQLKDKFIVAYAGNIGIKQGVEVLVQLAEATSEDEDLHYFIIGEGADKQRLVDIALSKNLKNLTFLPFLNEKQYFEMLQDIDVSFIAQKSQSGNVFFPSKLLGIIAMSKPLLISADLDSELAIVTNKAECGLVAPAGDIKKLKEHLTFMRMNRDKLLSMCKNGYRWVQQYDREVVLSPFLMQVVSL